LLFVALLLVLVVNPLARLFWVLRSRIRTAAR